MSLRELINSVALYPCCCIPHTTVPCSIVEHWSLTSVCWLEHLDMNHPNSKGDCKNSLQPLPPLSQCSNLAAVIPTLTSHISPHVISWSAAIGSEAWSRPHFTPSYTSEKHYLEVGKRWVDPLLLQLANSHRHQVHNTCNQFLTQRNCVWSIWLPKGTHAYDWSGYTCPVVLPRVRSIKIQDHMHTNLSSITD